MSSLNFTPFLSRRRALAAAVSLALPTIASLGLLCVGGGRVVHAQENPRNQPQRTPAGQCPQVYEKSFESSDSYDATIKKVEQALQGAGLTAGNPSTAERYADNSHVAVLVTCAQMTNGHTIGVIISASTRAGTAEFYRDDVFARIVFDPNATHRPGLSDQPVIPSDADIPKTGSSVAMLWGGFEKDGDCMPRAYADFSRADSALSAAGLTIRNKDFQSIDAFHDATNAHVAEVVTCTNLHYSFRSEFTQRTTFRFVVVGISTDADTAAYYRNTVRSAIHPNP